MRTRLRIIIVQNRTSSVSPFSSTQTTYINFKKSTFYLVLTSYDDPKIFSVVSNCRAVLCESKSNSRKKDDFTWFVQTDVME